MQIFLHDIKCDSYADVCVCVCEAGEHKRQH